jgi:predicted AAA+ superfamily ATPase
MNISSHPGQFVITGSTRHNALPGSVQALTGRIHRMRIFPFAQSEIEGTAPNLILRILSDAEAVLRKEKDKPATETREGYINRIIRGTFPLAVIRSPQARNRWFDDYVRQTIERDVPGIAKIRNSRGLSLLLRKIAAQTAQIMVLENISSGVAIDIATARDYIQLLEDVFMVYQLPAWGRTLKSRIAAKPKIHLVDSGIAARLMGLTAEKLGAKEASALTEFGHLLETFTVSEILKELSWLDDTVLTGHWHTHDDKEVDFVIERLDGSVYGFEIKSSGRTPADTFDGLVSLRKFAGDAFKAGFVFYTGTRAFAFEDRLYALPISKLWE